MDTVTWGDLPQRHPLVYVFPAAALLLAAMFLFGWRISLGDRQLQLCGAFAFAGFLGCFPRSGVTHIAFATPLVLPLLVLCLTKLTRSFPPVLRYVAVGGLIVLANSIHERISVYLEAGVGGLRRSGPRAGEQRSF